MMQDFLHSHYDMNSNGVWDILQHVVQDLACETVPIHDARYQSNKMSNY